jgi:eukaryotic-like serine/threonine-protein kinase
LRTAHISKAASTSSGAHRQNRTTDKEALLTRKFWEELVGSSICGGYVAAELLGSTEESAVYVTSHGGERAALKLVRTDNRPAPIPPLAHRHLISVFASGLCEVAGSPFHYFLTEAAEESLASVLASRALSPEEIREVLDPLLDALAYLHGLGLAHGSVKPSNILAKDEIVKLTADSVRPAGAIVSPEEDMRALGLTIIEALTQERQPSGLVNVPQPFRDIVEHSLQLDPALRWTAPQAAMRLSGTVPDVPVAVAVPSVEPVRKTRIPVWLLPAAGVIMLLATIFVLARGTPDSSMAASVPQPAVTQPPVTPPTQSPARREALPQFHPPSKETSKAAPKPTPFEPAKPPVAAPAPIPSARGWFVVAASYAKEADAAQEAQILARHFSQFKPKVFPPSAIDTHYLVIIGSALSQDAAESLRQQAVDSGLPPDTYIKKYPSGRH